MNFYVILLRRSTLRKRQLSERQSLGGESGETSTYREQASATRVLYQIGLLPRKVNIKVYTACTQYISLCHCQMFYIYEKHTVNARQMYV